MKTTLRKCIQFAEAAEAIKGRGGFKFRCAVAAISIEATNKINAFNEARKPSKGVQEFQEEISVHRENCTAEKEGKRMIDVAKFMPLLKKAKITHAKALGQSEKDQEDANKQLDKEIELNAAEIPVALLEEADEAEKFEDFILSRILPFAK